MSFLRASLSRTSKTSLSKTGGQKWSYNAGDDDLDTVIADSFFNNASKILKTNDQIDINHSSGWTSTKLIVDRSVEGGSVTIEGGVVGVIRSSNGKLLAQVIKGGSSNKITHIQVWGDKTNKPDEGNASVDGTLQWALDLLVAQAGGGEILLMGGDDYEHSTSLSSTGELGGIHIIGKFGENDFFIQPVTGTNINPMWDFGDGVTPHVDFKIMDCQFNGKKDETNTSSGVRWNDFGRCFFSGNIMTQWKSTAFEMVSDGTGFSSVNTIINNNINFCGANGILMSGAGRGFDHNISGNFVSCDPGSTNTVFAVDFGSRGGGSRLINNHFLNSSGLGCLRTTGGGMMVSNLYLDSALGSYWDMAGNGSSVSNVRCFNNGAPASSANGILVKGDDNNFSGVVFEDSNASDKIDDGILVTGDRNSFNNIVGDTIAGDLITFQSGATNNNLGFVSGATKAIVNSGGATNVQVDTTSIP